MSPDPADRLAAAVRAALLPLSDASATSVAALRERQGRAYTALWEALENYERAAGRKEEVR